MWSLPAFAEVMKPLDTPVLFAWLLERELRCNVGIS